MESPTGCTKVIVVWLSGGLRAGTSRDKPWEGQTMRLLKESEPPLLSLKNEVAVNFKKL